MGGRSLVSILQSNVQYVVYFVKNIFVLRMNYLNLLVFSEWMKTYISMDIGRINSEYELINSEYKFKIVHAIYNLYIGDNSY